MRAGLPHGRLPKLGIAAHSGYSWAANAVRRVGSGPHPMDTRYPSRSTSQGRQEAAEHRSEPAGTLPAALHPVLPTGQAGCRWNIIGAGNQQK